MSFSRVSYEMVKRGYTFALLMIDTNAAKDHIGGWAGKVSMNGNVMIPAWFLREETNGDIVAVPGSEPDPDSNPVTIPKSAVLGMFKWPSEGDK